MSAWAIIDTPSPPPLLPRLAGYVFFVALSAGFGWIMAEDLR